MSVILQSGFKLWLLSSCVTCRFVFFHNPSLFHFVCSLRQNTWLFVPHTARSLLTSEM